MELLRKSTTVVLLLLCSLTVVYAQQQPQFTHNMFNKAYTNPGYFGISNAICATALIRQQWVGFKDSEGNKVAPQTVLVAIDAPVKFLRGGVGLNIVQDQYGFFKDVTIRLGYSYHKKMGEGILGIGLNVDFLNKSLEFSKLIPVEAGDAYLSSQSANGVIITDAGVGAFLQLPGFYAGFSVMQMLQNKKELGGSESGPFSLKRHFYATTGYDIMFPSNPSYIITPSVFVKTDGASSQFDFNGLVKYNNKIWGGVTYRLNDAVGVLIGTTVKEVNIGYAYDIPATKLGSAGSHEIMVKYCFKLEREKTRTSYRNTRFL